MTSLTSLTLEVADHQASERFYASAFGLGPDELRLRAAGAESTGFRGFTLSLTASQPADVDLYVESALAAGATVLKPAAKSLWGYGAVVQAPDGTIWQLASSGKKNTGPATRRFNDLVLLLGVEDVKASKRFYVERGLEVAKSFGGKYAEFAGNGSNPLKLALYKRAGLAKLAGVPVDGTGSHRIVLGGTEDGSFTEGSPTDGSFTDPDGFVWEAEPAPAS